MEITTDILLKDSIWKNSIGKLKPIFRTYWDVYVLCIGIGIMYDKQLEFENSKEEDPLYVPRTKLLNNQELLDFMFQAAILTTQNIDLSEDERLELAFEPDKNKDFNKMLFLNKFANFGVTKLNEIIGIDDLETMDKIYSFLTSSIEGKNYEIDPLENMIEQIQKQDVL